MAVGRLETVHRLRYFRFCNVLHIWTIRAIPTYRVYRLYDIDAWFCSILTCLLVLGIYTPGFVLFLLAYWYLYIYAWFCAIFTCVLVYLVYTRSELASLAPSLIL